MRTIILCFLSFTLCIGCTLKEQKKEELKDLDTAIMQDFVIDTTLQRCYLEYPTMNKKPDNWVGEVPTAEIAFKIAEFLLSEAFGKDEIASQKPFSINLVDNEIWVIQGNFHQPDNVDISELWFTGTAYMEIKKSNGEILKATHGE